jgi:hypothetical protein
MACSRVVIGLQEDHPAELDGGRQGFHEARAADQGAFQVAAAIEEARQVLGEGASLHAIARHLTDAAVPTPRGGGWHRR